MSQQTRRTPEGKGQAPVILDHYAAEAIRPGATWRVYLQAADIDGDIEYIVTEIFQAGAGFYPVDFTRVKGGDTKRFAGYLYLNTPNDRDFVFDLITVRILVRDQQQNRSQAISLPLRFDFVDQQPPADKWSEATTHKLGPILIRIKSTERHTNDGKDAHVPMHH
jgi:hypothetical protein